MRAEGVDYAASWEGILTAHVRRYPRLKVGDLYKLVYQAALGSEHAGVDREQAGIRLQRELATVRSQADAPLVEVIAPAGRLLRVHLWPFARRGWKPDWMLDAFIQTASGFRGSVATLQSYWQTAEALAAEGSLPFQVQELRAWLSEMRRLGFPPVHHTTAFRNAYAPAYRVVARAYLPAALAELLASDLGSAVGDSLPVTDVDSPAIRQVVEAGEWSNG